MNQETVQNGSLGASPRTDGRRKTTTEMKLPVVKEPSEMKKDPMVMPAAAANLKNQNLEVRQVVFVNISLGVKTPAAAPGTNSPVVQRRPGVVAALHLDHEQREEQEEQRHAEADAVHRLVADQHVAVHVALDARDGRARAAYAETRNLQRRAGRKPSLLQRSERHKERELLGASRRSNEVREAGLCRQ